MSNKTEVSLNCGGCISTILLIIVITLLFFGLPTPWGKLNLDIFPPRLWDMNEEVASTDLLEGS